jgi:hypothetical protein
MAPAVAALATVFGQSVLDINSTSFINNFAKNLRNTELLIKHTMKVTDTLNLTTNSSFERLKKFSEKITEIQVDLHWMRQVLVESPSSLLHHQNSRRVHTYIARVEDLVKELRLIETSKLNNTTITNNANNILEESKTHIKLYNEIKACNGIRPVPVGVNIKGPTGIGKTQLVNSTLIPLIKLELYKSEAGRAIFGTTVKDWTAWQYTKRDGYDSNYNCQEFMYHDDAWQSKDHLDHEMYFSFMSAAMVGMNMSDNNQKGRLFKSLCVIQTCNQYPVKSSKIVDLPALQRRFKMSVVCEKLSTPPKEYDKDYKHLKLRFGTMTEHLEDDFEGEEITVQEFAKRIAEEIIGQYNIYKSTILQQDQYQEELNNLAGPDEAGPSVVLEAMNQPRDYEGFRNDSARIPAVMTATDRQIDNFIENNKRDLKFFNSYNFSKFEELREYLPNETTRWIDFAIFEGRPILEHDWVNEYVPSDQNDVGDDRLYQVISRLGACRIDPANHSEFWRLLGKQKGLRIMDTFGTPYIWGAALGHFTLLVPCSHENLLKLKMAESPSLLRVLLFYRRSQEYLERAIVLYSLSTMYTTGVAGIIIQMRLQSFMVWGTERTFWAPPGSGRWGRGFHNTVSILNAPTYPLHYSFQYFKKLSDRFTNKMLICVFRIMEFFGLDVDNYWRQAILRHKIVFEELMLLIIFSSLSYLMYKALSLLLRSKAPSIEQCSTNAQPKHIGDKTKTALPLIKQRCAIEECDNPRSYNLENEKGKVYVDFPEDHNDVVSVNDIDPMDKAQGYDCSFDYDSRLHAHGRTITTLIDPFEVRMNKYTVKRVKFAHQTSERQATPLIISESVGDYFTTQDWIEQTKAYLKKIDLYEYICKIRIAHHRIDGQIQYHVIMEFTCLTTLIQNMPTRITRAKITEIEKDLADLSGVRQYTTATPKTVLNQLEEQSSQAPKMFCK